MGYRDPTETLWKEPTEENKAMWQKLSALFTPGLNVGRPSQHIFLPREAPGEPHWSVRRGPKSTKRPDGPPPALLCDLQDGSGFLMGSRALWSPKPNICPNRSTWHMDKLEFFGEEPRRFPSLLELFEGAPRHMGRRDLLDTVGLDFLMASDKVWKALTEII